MHNLTGYMWGVHRKNSKNGRIYTNIYAKLMKKY